MAPNAIDSPPPTTADVNQGWKGFCEIESEPALFNVMLKEFGAHGVKVREVVSLDHDMLSLLPRPVYGLIFLYKWTDEGVDQQEQSCPQSVWFANQTVNNACASVALLNIVNNIPDLELAENLANFKEFTQSFNPADRGDAVANFEFVRDIHNSFARKLDKLNTDLVLKNEATSKAKGHEAKSSGGGNDTAFHFVAFMPIGNQLWKLDGLKRQPLCLGNVQDDWLGKARPDIEARMSQYEEDQIEFAILSLVKDPMLNLVPQLCTNVESIKVLDSHLDEIKADWRKYTTADHQSNLHATIRSRYGPQAMTIGISEEAAILAGSTNVEEILAYRQRLITQQATLRMDLREEIQLAESDDSKASTRRQDSGASMQRFARLVRQKQVQ